MTYFYRPILIMLGFMVVLEPFASAYFYSIKFSSNNTMEISSIGLFGDIVVNGTIDFFMIFNSYPLAVLCFWAAYCLGAWKIIPTENIKKPLKVYAVLVICAAFFQPVYYHLTTGYPLADLSRLKLVLYNLTFGFLLLFAGSISPRQTPEKSSEVFE